MYYSIIVILQKYSINNIPAHGPIYKILLHSTKFNSKQGSLQPGGSRQIIID